MLELGIIIMTILCNAISIVKATIMNFLMNIDNYLRCGVANITTKLGSEFLGSRLLCQIKQSDDSDSADL